jgi:PKD repeat protein
MNYSMTCDGTYLYNDDTEDFDEYIREDKICIIKSAGNGGSNIIGEPREITNPGTAKNVITVGALSYTINSISDGIDNSPNDNALGDRAFYSSQGPTNQDGRLKPDIVAPGGDSGQMPPFIDYNFGVVSTNAFFDGSWLGSEPWDDINYTRMAGTSMAAPHVTGTAALFYNLYYDTGYFTIDGLCPRDFRAHLIANAIPLKGEEYGGFWDESSDNAKRGYANTKVGFGLIDAYHTSYDILNELETICWYHSGIVEDVLGNPNTQNFNITIPNYASAERVIFVLSYEDEAGWKDENDLICLKHNLDMTINGLESWNELLNFGDPGNEVINEDPIEKIVDESPEQSYDISITGTFNSILPFESQRFTLVVITQYIDANLELNVFNTEKTVVKGDTTNIPLICKNTGGMTAAGVYATIEYLNGPGNHTIDDFINENQYDKIFIDNLVGHNSINISKSIELTAKDTLEIGIYNFQIWLECINKGVNNSNIIDLSIEVVNDTLELIADFNAIPLYGEPPLNVDFSDQSIGNITSWAWDFENDGIYDSYDQNPSNCYNIFGIFDVKLKVSDGVLIDSLINYNFINVLSSPPLPNNIVDIEYFFDVDPGFGNGNHLALMPNNDITIQTTIDVSNLCIGLHRLYVRAQDGNEIWGIPQSKPVLVQLSDPNDPLPDIVDVEYFFDSDPGLGGGTNLSFTPADMVEIITNIDVSALDMGLHRLYVRSQNDDGTWGIVQSKPVLVQLSGPNDPLPDIVDVEYFFDTDPGLGSGINFSFTPADIVEIITNLDVSSLDMGLHRLYVRAQNESGIWGIVQSKPVLVQITGPNDPLPNIVSVEYFIDTEPGIGSGTSLSFTPDTLVTIDTNIPLDSYELGDYVFYVRALDENGIWGIPQYHEFTIGEMLTIPQNVTLISDGSTVTILWDSVVGANSYRIYSSTDPYSGFELDETGVFNETSWTTPNVNEKRFYYVTAHSDPPDAMSSKSKKNIINRKHN